MLTKFFHRLRNVLFPVGRGDGNWIFFLAILVLLLGMSFYQLYFWKIPLKGSYILFYVHAGLQPILEAGFMYVCARLLHKHASNWILCLFVGLSFFVVLIQALSFSMLRIMDVRIPHFIKYIVGSGMDHFLSETQSQQNGHLLIPIILIVFLAPILGVMLYRFTGVLARSYPKPFTFRALCYSLYALALILGFIDFKAAPSVDVIAYQKYKKALPFGSFFIGPQPHLVKLSKPMADARNEAQTVKNLKDKKLAFDAKPNIFLFVIESLRRDFVTEAVAPNLYGFGSKNYSFPYTHANANCTHTSWHAIFHADVPVHWTEMQSTWSGGSIPLRALKDAGYKINLLCASNIETFQMDKLIFGHEHQLIDTIYQCKGNVPASECDRRAMKALERRIEPTGNVYIVFLDSTHAKYSVPPDYALKFEPSAKDVNYLHITPKTLDLIKNRYRNSISYVDSLFGPFFDGLKRRGLYDDSIIVITADHGEEFFEDGAMFHGMHLNEYQTSVPLFYKFQKNRWQSKGDSSTHMDIFPSILHYLTKQYEFANLFDGESIFMNNRWPYRVAVMQNGSFHPEDFRVTGEGKSYYFRYMETRDVSASQGIEVLTTPPTQESLPAVLGPLISH